MWNERRLTDFFCVARQAENATASTMLALAPAPGSPNPYAATDADLTTIVADLAAIKQRVGDLDEIKARMGELDEIKARMGEIDEIKARMGQLNEMSERIDEVATCVRQVQNLYLNNAITNAAAKPPAQDNKRGASSDLQVAKKRVKSAGLNTSLGAIRIGDETAMDG
jgi:hypothetical protein